MNINRCAFAFLFSLFFVGLGAQQVVSSRSLGNSELRKDTLNTIILHALANQWKGWPSGCETASVTGVTVIERPANDNSGWKERWSMSACGAVVDIDVIYSRAPDGGMFIRTALSSKAVDFDVQGGEIVGLWTGIVTQPGVGEFETWLTFISEMNGVSQYPIYNCGGVLSGEKTGKASYSFKEKIAWGGTDEIPDGCISGKMSLVINGDEMVLEWTGSHDGNQESASGTLRRHR